MIKPLSWRLFWGHGDDGLSALSVRAAPELTYLARLSIPDDCALSMYLRVLR